MRGLSKTLLAAQKHGIAEPVAQVVIDDRHVGVFRPRWEQWVDDTVSDGFCAVGLAYDGAILRARVDPASNKLYVQRVSDANTISQWTTWTLLASDVSAACPIALAWDGNVIEALFYVLSDERTIICRASTNNGQTWSSAATVVAVASGHRVRSLAASLNAGMGTLYCFYSDDAGGVGQARFCSVSRAESGGGWSAPVDWGRGMVNNPYGLAVEGLGDGFRIALCCSGALRMFVVPVESLASWPAPSEVLRSDVAAVSFRWPSIALGLGAHYAVYCVETNSRAGYQRLQHINTPDWQSFGFFPRPYQMAAGYGAAVVTDAGYHYLCTARAVYRAARWFAAASQRVEVSSDVLALRLSEQAGAPGRLLLALRNDDGRYNQVGKAGAFEAIKQGSQVSVRLGYHTSAGDEVSYYRPYWLVRLVHQRRAGARAWRSALETAMGAGARSLLLLEAVDGWGIVERARARQGYLWHNTTILAILSDLLTGFGFRVTNDGSMVWQRGVARFALNPGASLGEAVRRLLAMAGGDLLWQMDESGEETWPSAVAHLMVVSSVSTYHYGDEHPILAADDGQDEQACTHVIVLGDGLVMGEALDWEMIELGNEDRVELVVDRRLQSAADAEERAQHELAAWQRATASGFVVVPPNVGQEVLDTISISDAAAGLSDAPRLVVGNDIVLDRERGVFEQRLTLGKA